MPGSGVLSRHAVAWVGQADIRTVTNAQQYAGGGIWIGFHFHQINWKFWHKLFSKCNRIEKVGEKWNRCSGVRFVLLTCPSKVSGNTGTQRQSQRREAISQRREAISQRREAISQRRHCQALHGAVDKP